MNGADQLKRLTQAVEAYRRGDLNRHEFQALVLAAFGALEDSNVVLEVLLPGEVAEVLQNKPELSKGPLISLGSAPPVDTKNEDEGIRVFDILVRRGTEAFNQLNFNRAAENVLSDAMGDWFKDPWGLPEVEWLAERGQHVLNAMLISSRPPVYGTTVDVPKAPNSWRPATVIDPLGRLVYQAIVDSESARLTGELADWTYGWRVPPGSNVPGKYAENNFQWTEYLERVGEDAELTPNALRTDIEDFFSSIKTDQAVASLFSDGSHAEYLTRLVDMWNEQTGRSGLPQRSLASAVIANSFLAKVDDVVTEELHQLSKPAEGSISAVRWMDDLWIFSPPTVPKSEIEAPLLEAIENLGLTTNKAKTSWLWGDELNNAVDALDFSYELYALESDKSDPEPLVNRARTMLQSSSLLRTQVGFLARTALRHELHEILDLFVDNLDKMTPGIDQVCRTFREMKRSSELRDWLLKTLRSSQSAWIRSSVFQLIPKRTVVTNEVMQVIQERAVKDQDYMVTSVALSYLVDWDPSTAIEIVRTRANTCDNPSLCRSLALTGAKAKMRRTEITRILDRFPECFATLEMLRDTDFSVMTQK